MKQPVSVVSSKFYFLFSLLVDLKRGGGLQVFFIFSSNTPNPDSSINPIDLDTGKPPYLKGNLLFAKPSM